MAGQDAMTWIQVLQLVVFPIGIWMINKQARTEARHDASIVMLKDELSQFKVVVAQTYATNTYLKDVEQRVVTAIDKLDKKLDRVLDRMPGHD